VCCTYISKNDCTVIIVVVPMKTVTNRYDVNNSKYFSRSIKNSIVTGSCHDFRDSFNGITISRIFDEKIINIKTKNVVYIHTVII